MIQPCLIPYSWVSNQSSGYCGRKTAGLEKELLECWYGSDFSSGCWFLRGIQFMQVHQAVHLWHVHFSTCVLFFDKAYFKIYISDFYLSRVTEPFENLIKDVALSPEKLTKPLTVHLILGVSLTPWSHEQRREDPWAPSEDSLPARILSFLCYFHSHFYSIAESAMDPADRLPAQHFHIVSLAHLWSPLSPVHPGHLCVCASW